jgi:hypothetical protein
MFDQNLIDEISRAESFPKQANQVKLLNTIVTNFMANKYFNIMTLVILSNL